jgi:pyruvate formate lyase activating enzyme
MKNIKGFLETSFVDWPGRVCGVVFLAGCNFRCPFCHNHPLVLQPDTLTSIPWATVLEKLTRHTKWLGGICISGGEPTLNHELPSALRTLKKSGWAVKLDTNGSQPQVLRQLLTEGLLDMISMDVKAPLEEKKYSRCAGVPVKLEVIKQSITLIKQCGIDHEFRMTVLPFLHSGTDILDWRRDLDYAPNSPLKLQNFNPRSTLDSALEMEKPYSYDAFTELQRVVRQKNNDGAANYL